MKTNYFLFIVALFCMTFNQLSAQIATYTSTGANSLSADYAPHINQDLVVPTTGSGIIAENPCSFVYGGKFTQPITAFDSTTMSSSSFLTRIAFRCLPTNGYKAIITSISVKMRKTPGSSIKYRIGYTNNSTSYIINPVDIIPTELPCDANMDKNTVEYTWDMADSVITTGAKLSIRLYMFNAPSESMFNLISLKVNGCVLNGTDPNVCPNTALESNKVDQSEVEIYKNSNKQVVVECKSAMSINSSVSIYNSLGQKILSQQLKDMNTTLNATHLKGVYFVTVKNGDRIITKKITIN